MLKVYKSIGEELVKIDCLEEKGSWINLVKPSKEELQKVSIDTGVPVDFLEYPLDEEEISRIEFNKSSVLVIIKIPLIKGDVYDTIPIGIVITDNQIITICLENNPIIEEFSSLKIKEFYTYKKTRFLLQIFFKTAIFYLRYLRQIDKKSEEIQFQLHQSTKNEELIKLLSLGKSLVYLTTSLRANEIVMEKLLKSHLTTEPESIEIQSQLIKLYTEDKELLEDVIIENKQAIEMGDTYTSILNSTMDAFASVISNNLNIVVKFLTAVTIVLMIPTMLSSFYGMNVVLPFQSSPHAFAGILTASIILSMTIIVIFIKRRLL